MRKSAAIIGKAATAVQAPYDDPEWEIWGLAWVSYPRESLLFDIHTPSFKADPPFDGHYNSHKNPEYFERVNGSGVPVVCHPDAMGGGPLHFHNGRPYPFEKAAAMSRGYLECTVSYMIALAIMAGYERIGFWGCHFAVNEERRLQLPSVSWLMGLAEGRGIELVIGPGQPLLCSGYVEGRYGVDQRTRWGGGWNS
jgi:hypothetical protein